VESVVSVMNHDPSHSPTRHQVSVHYNVNDVLILVDRLLRLV